MNHPNAPRAVPVATKANIANPALKRLEFLIGDWVTEGTHPMLPGQTLHGRTVFEWHEGGAFIVMRMRVDAPDFPEGIALIASDDGQEKAVMTWFDERGTSRIHNASIGQDTFSWRRDDPEIAQNYLIRADGPDRMSSTGRISENGKPWTDDLCQVFRRADA